MKHLSGRRVWLAAVLGFVIVCAAVGVGSTFGAAAKKDSVHITVAPKTGKYGTKYNVSVKAKATASGEELTLDITNSAGTCPTDYTSGFGSLGAIANAKGKPVAPKYVHGNVKENVHAKITIGTPGTYGICAYLVVGSVTKAYAASHFTITQ